MRAPAALIEDLDLPPPGGTTAREELAALGTAALPDLLAALEADVRRRTTIAELLIRLGTPAVPGLIIACGHPKEAIRCLAAWALTNIASRESATTLCGLLRDRDASVRRQACEGVRKLAEPSHAPMLAEAMDSQDDLVRLAAVETLGRLRSLEAVPALCAAVEDGSPGVRCAAVRALGEIRDVRALDELIGALGGDPMLRREAAEALGHLGHPAAAGPLCAVLLDRDGQLQLRASEALERLGPVAAQSVCAMLGESDRMVFWTIIRLGPATIPYLVDGLQDHRDRVRRMSALALGELCVRFPVPELRSAIPALKRGIHRFVLPPDDLGKVFRVALERIEQATAQSSTLPLPAAAPIPWPEQFPLPAYPTATGADTLPIPGSTNKRR